nr:hypothetical protein [Fodinicola feengrottensis]
MEGLKTPTGAKSSPHALCRKTWNPRRANTIPKACRVSAPRPYGVRTITTGSGSLPRGRNRSASNTTPSGIVVRSRCVSTSWVVAAGSPSSRSTALSRQLNAFAAT